MGWLSRKAETRFDEEESRRFGRLILRRRRDWLGVSSVNLSRNLTEQLAELNAADWNVCSWRAKVAEPHRKW
jgi:hypothetical protein